MYRGTQGRYGFGGFGARGGSVYRGGPYTYRDPRYTTPTARFTYLTQTPAGGLSKGMTTPTAAPDAVSENPTDTPNADTAPTPPAEEARTFTQAELDAILSKRLSKFADYDDLRAKVEESANAGRTELEKAQAAADTARQDADSARAELAAARRDAVVAAAAKDAHDPSEVARLLDVADDASDDEVAAAVANLLAAKPYLVRGPAKPQPTPGTSAPATDAAAGLLTLEQIGRLDPRQVAKDADLYAQVIKSRAHWAKHQ